MVLLPRHLPDGENPLPGYRAFRLSPTHMLPDRISIAELAKYYTIFSNIGTLVANGLSGVDLVHCWVLWRILPLSRRDSLMCEYTSNTKDPQHYNQTPLTDEEATTMVKSLLGETLKTAAK